MADLTSPDMMVSCQIGMKDKPVLRSKADPVTCVRNVRARGRLRCITAGHAAQEADGVLRTFFICAGNATDTSLTHHLTSTLRPHMPAACVCDTETIQKPLSCGATTEHHSNPLTTYSRREKNEHS
jgi:hypothetical protein